MGSRALARRAGSGAGSPSRMARVKAAKSGCHRGGNRRGRGNADGTSITGDVTPKSQRMTLPSHSPGLPHRGPCPPGRVRGRLRA
jgi:hypothetical protein